MSSSGSTAPADTGVAVNPNDPGTGSSGVPVDPGTGAVNPSDPTGTSGGSGNTQPADPNNPPSSGSGGGITATANAITFTVSDPDNNFDHYDISDSRFVIDANGQLKLAANASLNFEAEPTVTLIVKAVDALGAESNAITVTINVNDINEAPTDIHLSNANIDENVAAGTVIGTLTDTDPDTNPAFKGATYTLVNGYGDNAAFTILNNELKINASPNFEAKYSYDIKIHVDDGSPTGFDKAFTISVNDINEAPTVVNPIADVQVNENATLTSIDTSLAFHDPDNGDVLTYSAKLSDGSALSSIGLAIDSSTGVISGAAPSVSADTSYTIDVTATDKGGLYVTDSFDLKVLDTTQPPANPYVFDYNVVDTFGVRSLDTSLGQIQLQNMPGTALNDLASVLDFSINANNHYQFSLVHGAINFGQAELTNVVVGDLTPLNFAIDTSNNGVDATLTALVMNNADNVYGETGSLGFQQIIAGNGQVYNYSNNLIYGLDGNDSLGGDFVGAGIALAPTPQNNFIAPSGNTFNFGNDVLVGGNGNDIMSGDVNGTVSSTALNFISFGSDVLYGGEGNNTVVGDVSDGMLWASTAHFGNDQIIIQGSGNNILVGDAYSETVSGLNAYIQAFDSIFYLGNDSIQGGSGSDIIVGDVASNLQIGLQSTFAPGKFYFGNDQLFGGAGNDLIIGDVGSFSVAAIQNNFSNSVFAFGSDTIEGGSGDDTLIGDIASIAQIVGGGAGGFGLSPIGSTPNAPLLTASDTFVYNLAEVGGLGNDIIKDFNVGNVNDVLEFHNVMDVASVGGAALPDGAIDINDLVALTDVVDNGSGGAKIMIYSDAINHDAAHLVGSINLELNTIGSGYSAGVAYTGPAGGSNEITDYANIHVAIV